MELIGSCHLNLEVFCSVFFFSHVHVPLVKKELFGSLPTVSEYNCMLYQQVRNEHLVCLVQQQHHLPNANALAL